MTNAAVPEWLPNRLFFHAVELSGIAGWYWHGRFDSGTYDYLLQVL